MEHAGVAKSRRRQAIDIDVIRRFLRTIFGRHDADPSPRHSALQAIESATRRAEEEAAAASARSRRAQHALGMLKFAVDRHALVTGTDPQGTILYANDAFCDLSGYSRADLIGQSHRIMCSGHHPPTYFANLWETISRGDVWRGEMCNRTKDGRQLWLDTTIVPLRNERGEITEHLALRTDVTQLRRAALDLQATGDDLLESLQTQSRMATELEKAIVAARAASAAKSEFLANMSHEIRTPMTAILGFTEILAQPGQTAELREECVRTIQRSGEHLLTIINDILDVSKIEAGKMTVERIDTSAASILSDVHDLMMRRAESRGLRFTCEIEGAIPAVIRTDPTRLRQVLVNLVGNAIKFTSEGYVRVAARMASQWTEGGESILELAVIDTGVGMSPDQISRLFQPFSQADSSTTRRYGGTGLGLTISRWLAEALGGGIEVVSMPGRGSTFTVRVACGDLEGVERITTLEDQESAPPSLPAAPEKFERTLRILLAEDGPDNQRLISFHLTKAGAVVDIAGNGREAIDCIAREMAPSYDVILMDMQMPEMDGYTACRELRVRGIRTPILALTANAMAGDRERCLEAGCDAYATKPIDRVALVRQINALSAPIRRA